MQQRIKLPQIQGHYLTLTLKDSLLSLEIEEESSGRTFCLDLDEDSIDQVTDGLFQTSEDLFRGLQDGANQTCPGITLSLSKGKLIYTVVFSTETTQRYSFILNLTEKRMDQVEGLERHLKLLEKWKDSYEAKNEDLMKQMDQKLDTLQKLCEDLKRSVVLKPNIYFNNNSVNASKFNLSDHHKTVTSIVDNTPHGLEILPQIPSSGQFSYSLRIKNSTNNKIYFGITSAIEKWNDVTESYVFLTQNGNILGRVTEKPIEDGPFGGNGAIIKMVVGMDQGTLTFFVDNRRINFCNISKLDKYVAFVGFVSIQDSVTLL